MTPYGAFPTILANPIVGLLWYNNMLKGPSMQGPHGSTESVNINGTEISPLVTWDSKITTLLALTGGIANITRAGLQQDNTYAPQSSLNHSNITQLCSLYVRH